MSTDNKRLGVDVGGVIMDWIPYLETERSYLGDNYRETPVMEGSLEALKQLNESQFKNNIYIISKYSEHGPDRMYDWIESKDFYLKTGIPKEHVHLCGTDAEKTPIGEKLELSHYVDDKPEILETFVGKIPNLYIFNPADGAKYDSSIQSVSSWADLLTHLQV